MQATLTARARTVGAYQNMLVTSNLLVNALPRLGEYAQAKALDRRTLQKRRHVPGRGHFDTLVTSILTSSLSRYGRHDEAVEIMREVIVSRTRLPGADHERTLMSENNLAYLLFQCDQMVESEQPLRETLALSLCALGPTHETTQSLFCQLCALGVAAPDERPGWAAGLSRWALPTKVDQRAREIDHPGFATRLPLTHTHRNAHWAHR